MSETSESSVLGISSTSVARIPRILDLAVATEPKLVPCFVGDTGIGKSPITAAWAKARGMPCHVQNFGHMQAQDVSMLLFAPDGKSSTYVPMDWLLRVNEDAEKHENGAVLFLDEVNRAPRELLNAMFTLPDDRRVHDFRLHDRVMIVAAMNPTSDGYDVNRFERDPAMRKRLSFIHVHEDLNAWLEHAIATGMPSLITGYLRSQGDQAFYNRALRKAGKVFPSPAGWEKAARIVAADERLRRPGEGMSQSAEQLISGILGTDMARALVTYEAEQSFIPDLLFGQGTRAAELHAALLANPVDPKVVAFRTAAASWLRYIALNSPVPGLVYAPRLRNYLEALPSDQLAAFLTEVGEPINRIPLSESDRAWKALDALYVLWDVSDLVQRAASLMAVTAA